MPRKGMRTVFFKPLPSDSPATPTRGDPLADTFMAERIASAEPLIRKWAVDSSNPESPPSSSTSGHASAVHLFREGRHEAELYLSSVKDLHAGMLHFIGEYSNSGAMVRAHELLQTAVRWLSHEFHRILSSQLRYPDHPESVSSQSSRASTRSRFSDFEYESEDELPAKQFAAEPVMQEDERVPNAAVSDLKAIADCMFACGYGKECIDIYKILRRSVVDEELYHLGFERRIGPSQMQKMDWEVLEGKVRSWLSAVKRAVQTLFYGERILCDQVFAVASASVRESVFSHVAQDAAVALFGFAEGAAKAIKRSPERIFLLLDLYEAVANLWPDIKSTFSSAGTSAVRSLAINSLIKLREAVRVTLGNFEAAIRKDSSKQSAVPSGGIHPLTRNVMNYLALLADYGGVLTDILADRPTGGSPKHPGLPDSYFAGCDSASSITAGDSDASAMFERFAWLVLVLLCKLDGKAERYKDVALSYLFLANNLRYVIDKVAQSNLRHLLGEHWVEKHEAKVKLYASNYERTGWNKVFSSLADLTVEISFGQAKESLRKFKAALEEVRAKQAGWAVPDSTLRDEIALSLAEKLVPAYRRLYDSRPRGDSAVKYSPDDLDSYLAGMLRATGGGSESLSTASSRSSSHWPSPFRQIKGRR
ncbi:exocyst complex component EXO70H1-like [Rhodamnia argentea]|uniref:Exocyst subunit Exo70 family protein n=1 Tax=Rhodamnia argentea TaxID=178133 RepID=A0A8B8NQU1_9MYRT|nr:exocyst complex component EXO70H1-like [Rhodamnia argentea]